MSLLQRASLALLVLVLGLGSLRAAEKLTQPKESIAGLRPGNTSVDQLSEKYGKPDVVTTDGLLSLYGGAQNSEVYGWFMVQNPSYTVPDLVVETAPGSDRIDLITVIGYDGFKTEKGVTCFQSEEELIKAYGAPAFAFAVPMNGFTLRELYYPDLGISFDVAPTGPTTEREVVAIYVTYPEFLQRAITMRKDYIARGTGEDITYTYRGGHEA